MKLIVFKVYEKGYKGDKADTPYTYDYEKYGYKADLFEQVLKKNDIRYERKDYKSITEYVYECEFMTDDHYTDGDTLEYLLELLDILEV